MNWKYLLGRNVVLITYLPPCTPHLNIAETQKVMARSTRLHGKDKLFYVANRWLAALGKTNGYSL